jgi:hypothetical protein
MCVCVLCHERERERAREREREREREKLYLWSCAKQRAKQIDVIGVSLMHKFDQFRSDSFASKSVIDCNTNTMIDVL